VIANAAVAGTITAAASDTTIFDALPPIATAPHRRPLDVTWDLSRVRERVRREDPPLPRSALVRRIGRQVAVQRSASRSHRSRRGGARASDLRAAVPDRSRTRFPASRGSPSTVISRFRSTSDTGALRLSSLLRSRPCSPVHHQVQPVADLSASSGVVPVTTCRRPRSTAHAISYPATFHGRYPLERRDKAGHQGTTIQDPSRHAAPE
jgi:hypothetical protein